MQGSNRADEAAPTEHQGRSPWQKLRAALQRRRLYLSTLRHLRSLPQNRLEEMGLSRGMISRVAYETAYGRKD